MIGKLFILTATILVSGQDLTHMESELDVPEVAVNVTSEEIEA